LARRHVARSPGARGGEYARQDRNRGDPLRRPRRGQGQEVRLSYQEIDRLSDRVAGNLRASGVVPGDTVSFQLPNWWEFTVLHLACLKAGAVSNPLMVIFRDRELTFMLALAETKVLVVPALFRGFDYPAMVARLRHRLPALQHVFVAAATEADASGAEPFDALLAPATGPTSRFGPDDIVQLLYTSGTTGEPKGVLHSSNTLLSNLVPFAERLRLGESDVIHMPSPMAHQPSPRGRDRVGVGHDRERRGDHHAAG
jgi:cyclohexanecarboxylate-CoA ligase